MFTATFIHKNQNLETTAMSKNERMNYGVSILE